MIGKEMFLSLLKAEPCLTSPNRVQSWFINLASLGPLCPKTPVLEESLTLDPKAESCPWGRGMEYWGPACLSLPGHIYMIL